MLRWLVSAFFLALPVGTTIGVLLGIQAINRANGKPPPFTGGDDTGGLPGLGPLKGKDVVVMKCDVSEGIASGTKNGLEFSLTANPWGWKQGEPGNICLMANLNGNRTYATKWSAPAFNVTWQYPRASGTNNVHAFPNAKVMNKKFPVQAGSVNKLDFDVSWYLSLKNDTLTEITDADVTTYAINANVAVDMFLDADSTKAGKPEAASHEVMVWLANFGTDTFPIGKTSVADKGLKTKTLNGTDFYLYYGQNQVTKQKVLSWVASKPTNTFKGSLQPLLDEIFASNNADYPTKKDYLGYFAFGQEAYSSTKNVTFSVPKLSVDLETS